MAINGGPRLITVILSLLHGIEGLYNILSDDIITDPKLWFLAGSIYTGDLPPAWSLRDGLIFFDGCLYIASSSACLHRVLAVLLQHGGEALLRQVAVGFRGLPQHEPCIPHGVLLLQELPATSISSANVLFIDLASHELFHMAFTVLDGAVAPVSTVDFNILFGHFIDLTTAHPQPHDSFIMTFNGFLLTTEQDRRPFFTGPPRDELHLCFDYDIKLRRTPATQVIATHGRMVPQHEDMLVLGAIGGVMGQRSDGPPGPGDSPPGDDWSKGVPTWYFSLHEQYPRNTVALGPHKVT